VDDNLYQKDFLRDRITLLAIYMPIIRCEIQTFARLWNVHRIRRQPNRPNHVNGQPIMLYNFPERTSSQEYGLKIDESFLAEVQEKVSDFGMLSINIRCRITTLIITNQMLIYNIDIDEYLPSITKNWCTAQLQELGYPTGRVTAAECFPDGSRAHCDAYIQLRARIDSYITSKRQPELKECEKPTGAWNWNPLDENPERMANIEEIDIY
jgi:hypothetical protein